MRYSLLDTKTTPNGRTLQAATIVRMDIQPRNSLRRRQGDRQLQFCIPLVTLDGGSYRLRNHAAASDELRRVTTGTNLRYSNPAMWGAWTSRTGEIR